MIPAELLVSAYAKGWFPMAVGDGDIRWYSPDPRGIIPLDQFHVSRRLARVVRSGAFFGESMFHHVTDASKVALVGLGDHLTRRGYRLLDIQWVTEHLSRFGAVEVPRRTYLRLLQDALTADCYFR